MAKAARLTEMKVLAAFTWAHEGIRVQSHEPGDVILAEEDLALVALERGWAEATGTHVPLEGRKIGGAVGTPRKAPTSRRSSPRAKAKPASKQKGDAGAGDDAGDE